MTQQEFEDNFVNKIICGDCLEVMKDWPDKCVDLVLTDPPYVGLKGTAKHFNKTGVMPTDTRYESVGDLWGAAFEWIEEAWRVCRLGFLVFCCFQDVDEIPGRIQGGLRKGLITWDKISSPMPVNNVPHYYTEFIWAFEKVAGLNWRNIKTIVRGIPMISAGCVTTGERFINKENRALHPAQKPIALMTYLLGVGGKTVLDCFCGLGTTCVAAKMLGRRFIGIDISPEYCKIAEMRLKAVDTGVSVVEQKAGQMALFEEKF